MIYIHKQLGFYDAETFPSSYLIGTKIEDYDSGAYLLLSNEQRAFRAAHPDVNQLEVWNMEIVPVPEPPTPEPPSEPEPLAEARRQKLQEIKMQDEFSNKFFVSVTKGGVEIANHELWLDRSLRSSMLGTTLPAFLSDGATTKKFWTSESPSQGLEVPIDWAMKNIPLLEIYASRTYDLFQINTNAALAATSEAELAHIDVKLNYPHFLIFELNMDLNLNNDGNNITEPIS